MPVAGPEVLKSQPVACSFWECEDSRQCPGEARQQTLSVQWMEMNQPHQLWSLLIHKKQAHGFWKGPVGNRSFLKIWLV